ncbi:hypothetical protein [Mycoplasma zalophi]|uniref:hypothetical protein n=1 Tax=Mycoplasma zalophi TaxID=191287 RepID=UPI001C105B33|nr:hypothetical protein [Mycoplasma zalophi]MBU4690915.1 hypothetical protein [Mycoplasma zalophi]
MKPKSKNNKWKTQITISEFDNLNIIDVIFKKIEDRCFSVTRWSGIILATTQTIFLMIPLIYLFGHTQYNANNGIKNNWGLIISIFLSLIGIFHSILVKFIVSAPRFFVWWNLYVGLKKKKNTLQISIPNYIYENKYKSHDSEILKQINRKIEEKYYIKFKEQNIKIITTTNIEN